MCRGGRGRGKRRYQECAEEVGGGEEEVSGVCRGGRGRGKRRYQECAEEVGGGGRGGIRSVQRR